LALVRESMALRIEDYAIVGDCKSAALVGSDGSIDWLLLAPFRFGGVLCRAARHAREWPVADRSGACSARGEAPVIVPGTLVLETEFKTESGRAAILDFMPPADGAELVRIVVGRSGRVDFRTEFVARFDYGSTVPWISRLYDGAISAVAGPERLVLRSSVALFRRRSQDPGRLHGRGGPVGCLRSVLRRLVSRSPKRDRSLRIARAHRDVSGGHGAIGVPTSGRGLKLSNARSLRLKR